MIISYFSATATELPSLSQGVSRFRENGGRVILSARTQTQLFDQARAAAFVSDAVAADAIIITLHGGKASCPAFDLLINAVKERRTSGGSVPHLHIQPMGGDEDAIQAAREHSDGMKDGTWETLCRYLAYGGSANIEHALAFLRSRLTKEGDLPPPPQPVVQDGIYHPEVGHVPNITSYASEYIDPSKPTVGIWFFQTYWLNGNLDHIDAIIKAVESRGANVLPVFSMRFKDAALGNRGSDEVVQDYFNLRGKPRIDVLISAMSMSMTLTQPEYARVFPDLNVPVLQAMTSLNPYAVWKESDQGMAVLDVTFQAAQPEFDGNLITVPVATREEDMVDPITGALLSRLRPIPDRVAAIANLAINWAKLRRKPNAEKRVAIVFHHYPPRDDRIGCAAGLDTFTSVKHLLDTMVDAGYRIERRYTDGDELANEVLQRMTCDRRWLSPEQMAERAEASADRNLFTPWHEALPEPVQKKMTENWGKMPGDLFVHDDTLIFPGLVNGNVFLTIQPPRGKLENPEALLHDLHLSPPHHYLAHYRWMRDVFKADAIMHIGKHGSLEWLPGKALGLSQECYPDLAIMDLPNIYPYIINDPGEGTQAKRRSYCCIIDHLTPPFTNADLYEDLTEVERSLTDYTEAARQDPGKLPVLAGLLWDAVERADIHRDLSMDRETAIGNMDDFLARLHSYLSELSDTMISDGLHVLGQPPEGEKLVEFLVQLTRLSNGNIPSLREEITEALGYRYDELLSGRGKVMPGVAGETGGKIIARAHGSALEMIRSLAASGYSRDKVPEVISSCLGGSFPGVEAALYYIVDTLVPNILNTSEEMKSALSALSGGFVAPGPSGAPTRGQADILPTGRNFFSLDPRTIPTPAAWEVGKALGDALLKRCLEEQGKYPESIGMIVWGCPTMRNRGDDIAEILYLLGLRPIWQANGIVKGLEVITLEELGRPRIDVVPRISGFFRDAFPNLVQLIDNAVAMIAALAEPEESNFIRRHVLKDRDQYRSEGMRDEDAWRLATLRVFGCPPGTYGAGVAELVKSKQWRTRGDLAEAYITYSSHAYGQCYYGKKTPQQFRRLLSRMEVTVKNEDSREYDLLSCTDYYNYYGGMIAAAATVRGSMPFALVGDSSDPRRVLLRTTQEEARHVLRSRLLNPKWLEGLKRHGYKGAGDISKVMDIIIGWDATAQLMEDWMYERVANRYALDPDMQKWFKEVNPYALQNILDKLLETIERGMWNAEDSMQEKLRNAYLDIEGDIEEAIERAS